MMGLNVGSVMVQTTNERGSTPEEVAERCLNKMISVADSAPDPLKRQVECYRNEVRQLLVTYIKEAIKSDRTTVYNMLSSSGQKDVAEMIRRI
jgi:hypothetical protein